MRIEWDLSGDIGQVRTWPLKGKVEPSEQLVNSLCSDPAEQVPNSFSHVIKNAVGDCGCFWSPSPPLLKMFSTMASVPFHHVSTIFVLP